MKRSRKILLLASGVVLLLIAGGITWLLWPASDGRTPAERRQIADACFAMLHSPLTNEMDLQPDDPRIPAVIRALHPVDVWLAGDDAVIMCSGHPAEYHLSHPPNAGKAWVLYVAGPGYISHREILRFEPD